MTESNLIALALAEDIAAGDVTTEAIVSTDETASATIRAGESLVVCGTGTAAEVFRRVDSELSTNILSADGARVEQGAEVLTVNGRAGSILTAERIALNFLQILSGIATYANLFAKRARGTGVRICDTRKTIPGYRALAKYAVRCGGCHNHRATLADHVLIKDNHIAIAGSVAEAVRRAKKFAPHSAKIEVEADTLNQVSDALGEGVDIILLDNMTPETVRAAKEITGGSAMLEVSGSVTLENVDAYIATGVDVISIGALTHSAPSVDLGLGFSTH